MLTVRSNNSKREYKLMTLESYRSWIDIAQLKLGFNNNEVEIEFYPTAQLMCMTFLFWLYKINTQTILCGFNASSGWGMV